MSKYYFLCESDLNKAKELLQKEGTSFSYEEKKDQKGLSFFLVPIKDDKCLVLKVESDSLLKSIENENGKRERYLEKVEKAKPLFFKGSLYALIATFLILLSLGTGFFAVGFGMKREGGYYAFLVLAIAFLAISFYLIHKGAIYYEEGRERKNNALSLLNKDKENE